MENDTKIILTTTVNVLLTQLLFSVILILIQVFVSFLFEVFWYALLMRCTFIKTPDPNGYTIIAMKIDIKFTKLQMKTQYNYNLSKCYAELEILSLRIDSTTFILVTFWKIVTHWWKISMYLYRLYWRLVWMSEKNYRVIQLDWVVFVAYCTKKKEIPLTK